MNSAEQLIADLCPDGVEHKALREVGQFVRGSGLQKSDLTSTGFPAIHYGQIHTIYTTWTEQTVSYVEHGFAKRLRKALSGALIIVTT
ncbi:MAG: restriction endonuclease subunit S, partial [Coriobacteriia bacterium]|nr:restriction endonuclease subunit S [Coriobacteriia bacterium]